MSSGLVALISLLAALTFGVADFVGGYASRRAAPMAVVVCMELAGVLPLLVLFLLPVSNRLDAGIVAGGAVAGITGSVGLIAFYRAMATGSMGIAAPVSALGAGGVPVLFGLLRGEQPRPLQALGVVLGLGGIVLVGIEPGTRRMTRGLAPALLSGLAFGMYFILFHNVADGGAWALMPARTAGALVVAGVALMSHVRPVVGRNGARLVLLAGLCDAAGTAFFAVATRQGLLSLTALLTSLYPVVPVLLAPLLLGERLRLQQAIGSGAALTAAVLVGVG